MKTAVRPSSKIAWHAICSQQIGYIAYHFQERCVYILAYFWLTVLFPDNRHNSTETVVYWRAEVSSDDNGDGDRMNSYSVLNW